MILKLNPEFSQAKLRIVRRILKRLKIDFESNPKRLIGNEINGSIHIDESCFPKQGKDSVGVTRQYCERLGEVDNCQVGVFLELQLLILRRDEDTNNIKYQLTNAPLDSRFGGIII